MIVKQQCFKVKFLNGSSICYNSLRDLTEAVKYYSLEKLKEIVSMKLILLNGSPEHLSESWLLNFSPEPLPEGW